MVKFLVGLSLALFVYLATAQTIPAEIPDTVYINGNVITIDPASQVTEAFSVRDGKFLAVGSSRDIMSLTGTGTVVVDLNGKTVLP
ncbi:MAG: amidohydrolase, partial [Gammaproteobacteria bacterium]|nr:amidohydrolase [Gammaproteobacteria bacterium]